MRYSRNVLWVLSAATHVIGNTEIVNFATQESSASALSFTDKWPVLSPGAPTLTTNATSATTGTILPREICKELSRWTSTNPGYCPHELWLVLDLDAEIWRGFRKFTLRLSWPAFHPTEINMKIFEPDDLVSRLKGPLTRTKTRRKYARIQFTHTGVLTPRSEQLSDFVRYQVPVVLTLEPLHLGVLPSSVIPVLGAILLVVLAGIPLASKIDVFLRSVAQKAAEEERLLSKSN